MLTLEMQIFAIQQSFPRFELPPFFEQPAVVIDYSLNIDQTENRTISLNFRHVGSYPAFQFSPDISFPSAIAVSIARNLNLFYCGWAGVITRIGRRALFFLVLPLTHKL